MAGDARPVSRRYLKWIAEAGVAGRLPSGSTLDTPSGVQVPGRRASWFIYGGRVAR